MRKLRRGSATEARTLPLEEWGEGCENYRKGLGCPICEEVQLERARSFRAADQVELDDHSAPQADHIYRGGR